MFDHVIHCLPEEACGLAAGIGNTILNIIPITNRSHSSFKFEMDPIEQLAGFKWIQESNLILLAIYHSHPEGPSEPSHQDIQGFAYPEVVYIIWSHLMNSWHIHGYRIQETHSTEVELVFLEQSNLPTERVF